MPILSRTLTPLPRVTGLSQNSVRCLTFGYKFVPKRLKLDECPPDYKEFPERDLVNYPRPKMHMFSPKVRMGIFPESWFDFMYKKTGVTGPYLLGYGIAAMLISKEFYVIHDETNYLIAFFIGNYLILKYVGGKYAERYYERCTNDNENVGAMINQFKQMHLSKMNERKDLITRCESWSPMLFQAQKDQILMQLEENYRKRMVEYHAAVKKKLDYLVDLDGTKKRLQRKHIVDWVVDQVSANINEQVQKAAFNQCLLNLKTLSSRAQV